MEAVFVRRVLYLFVLLIALWSWCTVRLQAQALVTASKSNDITAFAAFDYTKPDFATANNTGGTFGVDLTHYFHWRVVPSLEARGNYSTGSAMTQKSLLAGIKLHTDFGRFHPYADLLAGGGTLNYASSYGYGPDRGAVTSFGGGVDIDLVRNFQFKLDVQDERWNLGRNTTLQPNGSNYTLSPLKFSVGIAYRFPMRPHNRQSDK